jgi:hypothetical protein
MQKEDETMKKINSYKLTKVDYVKSQMKINKLLNDNDVFDIQHTLLKDKATITFIKELKVEGKNIKLGVKIIIPKLNEGNRNQLYRALFYYLKAKFESLYFGFTEEYNEAFVKEFMPHIIADKTGKTISDIIIPNLNKALLFTDEGEQLFIEDKKEYQDENKDKFKIDLDKTKEVEIDTEDKQ